jgi:hypothetical protein
VAVNITPTVFALAPRAVKSVDPILDITYWLPTSKNPAALEAAPIAG